jgi:C1A family cysteine protease
MNKTPKLGRGLGRKADRPDERDYLIESAHICSNDGREIAAPLPVNVDTFAGLSLPVYDQGELGSCTANAGVLYRRFLAQKFSKYSSPDQDLSRLFLYYQERLIDGDVLDDDGSHVRNVFKVLASTGVCLESEDPYVPAYFASPARNNMPQELRSASQYKIGAYHRVPDVETARSVLASGYAIELGFVVYESFEDISGNGLMPMPKGGEQIIGGHAVVIRGYDDNREMFFLQNSWGLAWGSGGCFWMPYEFLSNSSLSQPDMWIGHLGKPWV